ncbi:uncharacterized protein K02A2.6-like [Liolophura sinensis]|uniref:uncharacterized protein K02A2.6-like n=1 Tax=Liolophura sinensis TaxID=3198878 RepID=UPI0031595BC9
MLSETTFTQLTPQPARDMDKLLQIFAYNTSQSLEIVGKLSATVTAGNKSVQTTFYITPGNFDTLLSYSTCVDLGLLNITECICEIQYCPTSLTNEIVSKYKDCFTGLGKLKGVQAKLDVDSSVQPVAHQHRRLPFNLRERTTAELKRLLELDIIKPVGDVPTPWVSPIRVVEKPKNPSQIRICVDMRVPNEAIQRERHITPTLDDIISELNESTIFSKLDLNAGYHQIELHPESRSLTTFSTHVGLFIYERLNFGVCSAAEVFQNHIRMALQGLPGVINLSDDVFPHGRDQQEHDQRL